MFIVSKDKVSIINLQNVQCVYIGSDRHTIKVDFADSGKGCQIGRYNSEAAAFMALDKLAKNLGKTEIYFMPEEKEVEAEIIRGGVKERQENYNGKKRKGHGGS